MTTDTGFSIFLGFALLLIAVHDLRQLRIPDLLNLSILVGGIAYWIVTNPNFLGTQLMAGTAFGGSIWLLREAHARFSGQIGLGLGDVKLAAAGAVWLNPILLPLFLFAASLSGLAYASVQSLLSGSNLRKTRIPFAPFLGASILFCWLLERWS